ncbi:replication initiation protein [Azohydromonas caseinilytica]|uniref:Replication initiation protein n=1 Tax=Azohydromonas caseinilytica TaxID=2728836 RepID=A0A848FJU4_9BURK|nr:replication initiation protein [Azohydromonas caseinilytica]NML18609.1 replication initiation protein [Azohydromonas caseinilytica]
MDDKDAPRMPGKGDDGAEVRKPGMKEEGAELRKPHEMIVMVPRSRRVTLTGRRLYNALLQVSQSRLQAMSAMPPADYMFEAPLPALLRTTGSSGEDRTAAKRYLREMRGLEVDWESTAPGDGLKWRGFSMLSEVAIEVRNGENWVSWSYPPTIMSALREPARWARIDLDVLAKLGSYAAVALYEICARYRDNPSGVTSRKPVQWWADALSPAPGGAERREWRKFKNERVKPAVEEINSETDIEIELIEHKLGRAVSEVQFAVRRKRGTPRPRALAEGPVDAGLVLRAESLGIREAKLDGLLKEFGETRVREQLDVLERRAVNRKLRGIEHAYAYLRSLLRHGEADAALSLPAPSNVPVEEGAAPVAPQAVPPRPASPASVLAVAADAGPGAEAWLNGRIAQIKAEIAALDPVQRRGWVDRALQDLAARGMLSAVVSRRAAQGDVLHGVLGSVLVRVYAEAVHGPGWDRPSGAA